MHPVVLGMLRVLPSRGAHAATPRDQEISSPVRRASRLEIALRVKAAFVWLLAFPGETGQVSHGMRSVGTAVAGDWFPAEKW